MDYRSYLHKKYCILMKGNVEYVTTGHIFYVLVNAIFTTFDDFNA